MFELIMRVSITFLIGISWAFINLGLKVNTRAKAYIKRIYNSLLFLFIVIFIISLFASQMDLVCFFVILGLFFSIWGALRISSIVINKDVLKTQDNGEIYNRTVEATYSPAVVSYLMNQNLELKKDLMATIINICAKKALKIEDGRIKPIHTEGITEILTEDEKYIYDCIDKKQKFSKEKWYKMVVDEFNKLCFTTDGVKISDGLWFFVVVISATIVLYLSYLSGKSETVVAVFMDLTVIMALYIYKYWNKQSYRRYTEKGALEVLKWKRFKVFLKDFSLIDEADPNKVVLLEKYLSYGMALNINKKYSSKIMKQLNINLSIDIIDKIKEEFANIDITE